MTAKSLIIIGGGPGGYAAALEAAKAGLSVKLIDRDVIGGTCLNRGCIPSKFFLANANAESGNALAQLIQKKDSLLETLRGRMMQALKAGKIEWVSGTATVTGPQEVVVNQNGTESRHKADVILVATGTTPIRPALFPKHPTIYDSTSLLSISKRPKHLVVVGGGYIGCELACAFHGLGSSVTLIEKENRLLGVQPEFEAAAGILQRAFQKRGLAILLGTTVDSLHAEDNGDVSLTLSNGNIVKGDAVLLALGRAPETESVGLKKLALEWNGAKPKVNRFMQTSIPTIYAIGDIENAVPLAHVASKEAEIAVAHLCGKEKEMNYALAPRCIYTEPEAAAVGLTEAQAKEAGHETALHRYHWLANPKAMIENQTDGMWITLTDKKSRRILGAQIIGPHATELIHLPAMAIAAGWTVNDVAEMVFAHPSLAEGFGEAMKKAGNR